MKRVFLAAFVVAGAGCWPFDFDGALAICADGGNGCASDAAIVVVPDAGSGSDSGTVVAQDAGSDAGAITDAGTSVTDAGEPTPDAGRDDAGTSAAHDAGTDGGLSSPGRGCLDANLACLDFETASLAMLVPPWFNQQTHTNESATIEGDTSGHWLRIDYGMGMGQYKIATGVAPNVRSLYVRAWMKWSGNQTDDVELWALRASANSADRMVLALGKQAQANVFAYAGYSDGGYQAAPTLAAPTSNTWHCVSGLFEPGSGTVSVSFPNAQSMNVMGVGSFANPLDTMSFGGFASIDAGTVSVWMDDLAVSDQPLLCP